MTCSRVHGPAAPVALVNGTLAHLLDFDDIHYDAAMHAGADLGGGAGLGMARGVVVPHALAGIRRWLRGRCCVSGHQRHRVRPSPQRGWHPTAAWRISVIGCRCETSASSPSRDRQLTGTAAAQAGGLVSAGGTASKPLQVGKAAMGGVIAAEMAELSLNGNGNSGSIGSPRALPGHQIGRDVPRRARRQVATPLETATSPTPLRIHACCDRSCRRALPRRIRIRDIRRSKFSPIRSLCRSPAAECGRMEARHGSSPLVCGGTWHLNDATPDQFGGEHLKRADIRRNP